MIVRSDDYFGRNKLKAREFGVFLLLFYLLPGSSREDVLQRCHLLWDMKGAPATRLFWWQKGRRLQMLWAGVCRMCSGSLAGWTPREGEGRKCGTRGAGGTCKATGQCRVLGEIYLSLTVGWEALGRFWTEEWHDLIYILSIYWWITYNRGENKK